MRPSLHAIVALVLCAGVTPSGAESTVVRDTRLDELGSTPSLGRGFTPAISALHGVCFETMPTHRPSFDFSYRFEALDLDAASSWRGQDLYRNVEVADFVANNTRTRTIVRAKQDLHVHYLVAALVVESYYASIDEAHAELSADALGMLRTGDVVGFFKACGTHYVRSVNRRAYFLTLFSYTSTRRQRDGGFELKLENAVRRLRTAGDEAPDASFVEQARTRDLRIVTRSIGLRAQADATLIPFDVESYKAAVKEAFVSAQDETIGRVTSMEVMPWLTDARVLTSLDLGAVGVDRDNWNERRRILSDNAEFYVELSSQLEEMQTTVHRAEACRRDLIAEVGGVGALDPAFAGAVARSHRTGERLPLEELVAVASDQNIDEMRRIALVWRHGDDGTAGAAACMDELERTALSGRYHNSIPACEWTRAQLPGASVINQYCPPEIERARTAPGR